MNRLPLEHAMGQRQLLFVLGMGRSGTSAMARTMSLCGATLPSRLLGAARGNPTGHWEALDAVELNDAFMQVFSSNWYDASLRLNTDTMASTEYAAEFEKAIGVFITANSEEANILIVKDPRISGLAPYWLRSAVRLGYDPKIIFCFRHPTDVAASLWDRDHLSNEHSKALWLKYNLICERDTRYVSRVFVEFSQLLENSQATIERIVKVLSLDLGIDAQQLLEVKEFLRRRPRRIGTSEVGSGLTSSWAQEIYDWMKAASMGDIPETAILDRRYLELADVERMYRARADGNQVSGDNAQALEPLLRRYEDALLRREPVATKLARILEKAGTSPFRTNSALPIAFNPVRYVLKYPDLIDAEIDPFEHYLSFGIHEGRSWSL